ncbi:MAG: hypothetical protein QM571_04290 [Micrococcaceae bacterium]
MTQMRPFKPMDIPGIYRLALKTAMKGRNIKNTIHNPDLYGHIFVGPYIFQDPTQTLVAVDEYGINAYMSVTQNIKKMDAWANRNWWSVLQEQYPKSSPTYTDFERSIIGMIHNPEQPTIEFAERYPVKVDIRIGKRLDHRDSVEKLLTHCLDQQWARGVAGIHTDIPINDIETQEIFSADGFVEDKNILTHTRMVRSL